MISSASNPILGKFKKLLRVAYILPMAYNHIINLFTSFDFIYKLISFPNIFNELVYLISGYFHLPFFCHWLQTQLKKL